MVSPAPTPGRGRLILHFTMAHKNQHIAGGTGSLARPGATKYSAPPTISCSMSVPPKGRGRADIFQALQVGSDTTKPGALPLQCCSRESGGPGEGTFPFPEGRERLAITEEPKVVMKHGEVGTKFQASANWIRLSLEQNNAVFEHEVQSDPLVDALNHRFKILNSQMERLGNAKTFDGTKLW